VHHTPPRKRCPGAHPTHLLVSLQLDRPRVVVIFTRVGPADPPWAVHRNPAQEFEEWEAAEKRSALHLVTQIKGVPKKGAARAKVRAHVRVRACALVVCAFPCVRVCLFAQVCVRCAVHRSAWPPSPRRAFGLYAGLAHTCLPRLRVCALPTGQGVCLPHWRSPLERNEKGVYFIHTNRLIFAGSSHLSTCRAHTCLPWLHVCTLPAGQGACQGRAQEEGRL